MKRSTSAALLIVLAFLIETPACLADPSALAGKARAAVTDGKKPLRTFLFIGQSNMVGWGDFAEIPEATRLQIRGIRKRFYLYDSRRAIGPLRPSRRKGGAYAIEGGAFGPEVGFALEISPRYPDETVALVKFAEGQTSLFAAWSPRWSLEKTERVDERMSAYKHDLYQRMLTFYRIFGAKARRLGFDGVRLEGVICSLGESDARFEEAAKSYRKNLVEFIKRLRRDLGEARTPFVYAQVNPHSFEYSELVRQAQLQVSKRVRRTAMVPTSAQAKPADFPKYDNLHYDTIGQLRLGRALAIRIMPFLQAAQVRPDQRSERAARASTNRR